LENYAFPGATTSVIPYNNRLANYLKAKLAKTAEVPTKNSKSFLTPDQGSTYNEVLLFPRIIKILN